MPVAEKPKVRPDGHPLCLGHDHVACNARDIKLGELKSHLVIDHNVNIRPLRTKGDFGRFHMLVHAVMGNPNLILLLELPENYGTGKQLTTKY